MVTGTSLSHVFPLDSALSERGVLEIGGCDALELAREFGTPAYVVAEADLRTRARAFVAAGRAAGHVDVAVVYASKACPCHRPAGSLRRRRASGATSPPAASSTSRSPPALRPSASSCTATPSPKPSCACRAAAPVSA